MSSSQRAGAREWIALAVLGIPAVLVMMNMSVLYLALPTIGFELRPTPTQVLWITDIYGFLVAGFLVTMGAIGDRHGHRRVLILGSAGFAAASILAAFSTDVTMLIVSRALQGVAAAALAPASLAIIRQLFVDREQRRLAITIWMVSFMAGGALGPLIGGALLQFFWWKSVFLIAVPAMLVLLATARILLPSSKSEETGPIDPLSVLLSLATPLAVVCGIKEFAVDGASPLALICLAVGAAAGVAFARRQLRLSSPMLDPTLFRIPTFSVTVLGMVVVGGVLFGTSLLTSQYLQLVLGFTPLAAGLWQLPSAVAGTAVALAVSGLAARVHPSRIMGAGAIAATLGAVLFTQVDREPGFIVAGSVVLFAGLTPFMALGTGLVLGAAPLSQAGAASAISETGGELGGALGVAVLGTVSNISYSLYLRDHAPSGLPSGISTYDQTLAESLQVADALSGRIGVAFADAARDAFSHAIHVHAAVIIVVLILLSAATLMLSRRPIGAPTQPREKENP